MPTPTQQAARFRSLHEGDTPLILPNVWDPLTAAMVAEAGFPAVATASAAVALSRGFDDGEQIPFEELVELVKRIGSVVDVSVSVDFERGYGDTPQQVGENTARLIEAGAVASTSKTHSITTRCAPPMVSARGLPPSGPPERNSVSGSSSMPGPTCS